MNERAHVAYPELARFDAGEDAARRDTPDTLEDAARGERDYVRTRLRDELGREPSEQELDEWLRDHTEGY
jgi:hypothetical protein